MTGQRMNGPALLRGTYAISGGLGSLGRAIAVEVLVRGGRVLLTGRRSPDSVTDKIGKLYRDSGLDPDTDYITYGQVEDVTNPDTIQHALDLADDLSGTVLNAAVTFPEPFLEISPATLRETFRVNVEGSLLFAQAAARRMVEDGGVILGLSSWASFRPADGNCAYGMSKAALEALIEYLALELAPMGIRAASVVIGVVDGGMAARHMQTDPSYRSRVSQAVPLGRLATPQEVATAVADLLGPSWSYLSGPRIILDGAAHLAPVEP